MFRYKFKEKKIFVTFVVYKKKIRKIVLYFLKTMPYNHNHSLLSKAAPFISHYLLIIWSILSRSHHRISITKYINFSNVIHKFVVYEYMNFTLLFSRSFNKFSTFTYFIQYPQAWFYIGSSLSLWPINLHIDNLDNLCLFYKESNFYIHTV